MTLAEKVEIEKYIDEVIAHGYGRVEIVVKDGRVLHVRPTKDVMLAKTPTTEER